jgi:hypothetical protein
VQAGLGLAVAQLLPAVPGVALGIPFGLLLYTDDQSAPASWMLSAALGVLLAVTALTAAPRWRSTPVIGLRSRSSPLYAHPASYSPVRTATNGSMGWQAITFTGHWVVRRYRQVRSSAR